jgi:hypothetical protein
MRANRYAGIVVVLGMIAVLCGTVSAGTGIVAGTRVTAAGAYPACTAPCECITEHAAGERWGADGYDYCSKTICGESADAMVQYYCLHQKGSTSVPTTTAPFMTTTAPAAVVQKTVQITSQTQVSSPEITVPSPSSTPPAAGAVTQKSPLSIATLLAAIGAVVLAGVCRE